MISTPAPQSQLQLCRSHTARQLHVCLHGIWGISQGKHTGLPHRFSKYACHLWVPLLQNHPPPTFLNSPFTKQLPDATPFEKTDISTEPPVLTPHFHQLPHPIDCTTLKKLEKNKKCYMQKSCEKNRSVWVLRAHQIRIFNEETVWLFSTCNKLTHWGRHKKASIL